MSELKHTGRLSSVFGQDEMFDQLPPADSPIYDSYLIQTLPDFLVQRAGAFETYSKLFNSQRIEGRWPDPVRLALFMNYMHMVNKLETGAYAEFGVGAGGSATFIYNLMNEQNTLYLFDTFDGFVKEDVDIDNEMFDMDVPVNLLKGHHPDVLIERISGQEKKRDVEIVPVRGRIPESFEPHRDLRFRFVHVDMDLYQPTADLLELVWDCVVPGGIMLFHDYGCKLFPGVAKAVDEFFNPKGITAVPLIDHTVSAIVIKPLN